MVLLAVANANYDFIVCDFGVNGRVSDGGVSEQTLFYDKLRMAHYLYLFLSHHRKVKFPFPLYL